MKIWRSPNLTATTAVKGLPILALIAIVAIFTACQKQVGSEPAVAPSAADAAPTFAGYSGTRLANTPTSVATPRPLQGGSPPVAAQGLNLLFYYSPACSHCAWQRPIIRDFEARHPELKVLWRKVGSLSEEEESLIGATRGHPVMVFFQGENTKKIVGETPAAEMESHLAAFRGDVLKAQAVGTPQHSTGGSGVRRY